MRSLVRVGVPLLIVGILIAVYAVQLSAVQRAVVKPPVASVQQLTLAGKPDLAIWTMQGTLAYTELGQDVTWKPRDRVRLEFALKNIGLGPLANESFKVSIFRNSIHQDTWILPGFNTGEAKSYTEYYEFNHGEKTTFVIQLTPLTTPPVEEGSTLTNNRRTLVIGEGEDTLLHANGTVYGVFTAVP